MTILAVVIGVLATLLLFHALFSLSLMLDAWDRPDRLRATAGAQRLSMPRTSFSVLLPARDEPEVIGDTLAKVCAVDYPPDLLEVIVICQRDDSGTIEAVHRAMERIETPATRLVIYDEPPYNKPHALTEGLKTASNEVVTVFDAEDDVHPEIFTVINTTMVQEKVGVVQGGVQLTNVADHWFSVFNCLEYFFYFKSRLHFNARIGMIPLGGNTVFVRRDLLDRVGGWDIGCLTEDADLGIRLSALGEPIRVIYNSRWVTREETPHSVRSFVKQRTRWHQGFLQVLGKGDWRRLPHRRQRVLAAMTLAQPVLDGVLLCSMAAIPLALLFLSLPIAVALLSFAPLYAVALQMLANVVGAVVYAREFEIRLPWWVVARMPFTYLPYQWLLGLSALRATLRHVRGKRGWEKTEHRGAHRGAAVPQAAGEAAQ
jgi:glycosyltransferase XagB